MKVLIITHTSYVGGATKSLNTVIDTLINDNIEIIIIAPNGPMIEVWENKGIKVIIKKPPVIYWLGKSLYSTGIVSFSIGYAFLILKAPFKIINWIFLLKRLIINEQVNFVYLNSLVLFPLVFTLRLIKKSTNIKIIWHLREVLNTKLLTLFKKIIVNNLQKTSDKIFSITTNEINDFNCKEKIVVIHNILGEPFPNLDKINFVQKDSIKICMAANFYEGKGVPDYINSFRSSILKSDLNVDFTLFTNWPIVGDKLDLILYSIANRISPLFRLINDTIYRPNEIIVDKKMRIIFNSNLKLDDFLNFDIYIRCDETGSPWGRDIIEAMSAGLIVIATGTCEEFVVDGITGFLIPVNNPKAISEKIEFLYSNLEILESMKNATIQRANLLFSEHEYKSKLLSAFYEV